MIELEELISYWQSKTLDQPPITSLDWKDVCQSTTAYLSAFRQSKEMLTRLAGIYEGLEQEGD